MQAARPFSKVMFMSDEKTEKTIEGKKDELKNPAKQSSPKKSVEGKPEHTEHKIAHDSEHKAEHKPERPSDASKEHKVSESALKAPEAKPEVKSEKRSKRKRASAKSEKVLVIRGKRKESVARATIQKGSGIVRVNKLNVEALNNKYVRDFIKEPIKLAGLPANSVNITVTVNGGGVLGQAQAARIAIAKALVKYFDDKALQDKFMSVDRFLLIEDSRRVESKKYKGPKARARFQKSYR